MSTERKTTDNHIGKNLAKLRKRKGWTQEELAEKSNTSRWQIQNLEAGKQKPSPATLARLENCLDVPSGTLTSKSVHEAPVFYTEAKTETVTGSMEWRLKNLSNDSPNTRALSIEISKTICERHSLVRGIMEHFGYTTTYIPTFDYTPETYRECIEVMKEFDAKTHFTGFYRSWDIPTEYGLDFDAIFKEEEEKYINEKLNYRTINTAQISGAVQSDNDNN